MGYSRGRTRLTTIDWLDCQIRICTAYGARYKPRLLWEPWDDTWSKRKRDEIDSKLVADVLKSRPK